MWEPFREAVGWSEKTPAPAMADRGRHAAARMVRVHALWEPDSADEDLGQVSRNLLKWMPHLFEFLRDAGLPWHNNAGGVRSVRYA